MANEERTIAVGNNSIATTNHHFSDGHTFGYLSFYDTRHRPAFPLTSAVVTRYILEIAGEQYYPKWIAGCLLGWCEALIENHSETFTSLLLEEVAQQRGAV